MPGGSCRFVFTINNYTDEDIDYLENTDLFHYVCYGREVGENLTPHLQGYFEFKHGNRKSLSACISALGKDGCPSKPHIEVAMGTAAQAIAYCEKDGIFWEKALDQKDKVSDQILMLLPISFLTVVLCRKSLLLSHQYL